MKSKSDALTAITQGSLKTCYDGAKPDRGLSIEWGKCPFRKGQVHWNPSKSVTEPGTEGAVVDRVTNLEQQISALSRPSHLLGLVHTPVDNETAEFAARLRRFRKVNGPRERPTWA